MKKLTNLKINSKQCGVVLIMFFTIITTSYAFNPVNLKIAQKTDMYLDSLISNPVSSLVLFNDKIYGYGDTPAKLYSDAKSLPLLFQANTLFDNIQLISVKISSLSDESIKISGSQLSNFKNLKYLVFTYEYPSCGNNIDETCLSNKTMDKLSSIDENLQVLYIMSIPQ